MTEITSVYIIGSHNIDDVDYESGISDEAYKNLKHIRPIDNILLTNEGRTKLGPRWNPDFRNVLEWGVPIEGEHMPKEYFFKGPVRQIADFNNMWGSALVSQKFKDVVEALEPGIHQFFPVKAYWPGKKPVEDKFYWFHICTALDSVSEEASNLDARKVIYSPVYEKEVTRGWRNYNNENLVFSASDIEGLHLWQDRFLVIGPWGSGAFKNACEVNDITGISLGDGNRYRVA